MPQRKSPQSMALEGVKVLEYAQMVSGPYCTRLLAHLGAEVIKVEEPGSGDGARGRGPFPGDIPHPERSGLFLHLNANKMGITLNLHTNTGRDIFKELVENCDILVENNPPAKMKELGLDYATLKKVNPQLIMTSITPFGQTGPYRDYKAYDINMQAAGGISYVTGDPEREPLLIPGSAAAYQAALNAAVATLIALYYRDIAGGAQHVDISEQECIASVLGDVISFYSYQKVIRKRSRLSSDIAYRSIWPMGIYRCKDGYVNLTILEPHQWRGFVALIGSPQWARDPKLEERVFVRQQASEIDLDPLVEEALKNYTKEELFHQGQRMRVTIAPINDVAEVVRSPQLEAREFFVEMDHPQAGRLRYPGAPFKLTETPWSMERPAPLLGEHNEEVYRHRLGYAREDLVRMAQGGII